MYLGIQSTRTNHNLLNQKKWDSRSENIFIRDNMFYMLVGTHLFFIPPSLRTPNSWVNRIWIYQIIHWHKNIPLTQLLDKITVILNQPSENQEEFPICPINLLCKFCNTLYSFFFTLIPKSPIINKIWKYLPIKHKDGCGDISY